MIWSLDRSDVPKKKTTQISVLSYTESIPVRWTLHRLDNTYNCPMIEYMSIDASRYRSSVALPLEYTDYGSFHRCFLIPWSKRLRQWCPRKFLLYVNLLDIFYVNFKQANLNQCCKDLEVLNALPLPPAPQDPDSMVSGSPTSCQTTLSDLYRADRYKKFVRVSFAIISPSTGPVSWLATLANTTPTELFQRSWSHYSSFNNL